MSDTPIQHHTTSEVIAEIGAILARGVLRLGKNRLCDSQPVNIPDEKFEDSLDSPAKTRIHATAG